MPRNLPRVIVLATGGTIAGRADSRSAHGYNAGGVTGGQLIASVPGLDRIAAIRTEQIANVGSQDMSAAIWLALAARIRQIIDRDEAEGIVITHGTDTLEETAFFLHLALPVDKPVALTGAMHPGDAPDADGPANLRAAVRVAASPQSRGRGVTVVMHGVIHDPCRVTKMHTTAVEAFASFGVGPMGIVHDAVDGVAGGEADCAYPAHSAYSGKSGDSAAAIRYFAPLSSLNSLPRRAAFAPLAPLLTGHLPTTLPHVAIVYAHVGMDASPVEHALRDGARGIVLAGLGNGNAPRAVLAALARAARQGVAVVRATRVPAGRVNRNVEVDDGPNGFVAAGDLNPQKARVLLQLLIACGITAPDAVQRAFDGDMGQG